MREGIFFCVQGTLEVVIGGEKVLLQEQHSIQLRADIFHEYNNVSDRLCTANNMVFTQTTKGGNGNV